MGFVIIALLFVSAQGGLLHWGACAQDQGKCATCSTANCACSQGTVWTFQPCMERMCMRCYQFGDGTFETQVAALTMSPTCPAAQADQAVVCAEASFRAIYSHGEKCIDLALGPSLNCIAAARAASGQVAPGSPNAPEPSSAAPSGPSNPAAVVDGGGPNVPLIVGVSVGAAVLLAAIAVAVGLWVRRRRLAALGVVAKSERELLSPPKAKNPSLSRTTSPTQTVASPRKGRSAVQQNILEQAVNDLV